MAGQDIGKEMLAFQERLAKERGYQPIGINLFLGDVREKYRNALPEWCNLNGDKFVYRPSRKDRDDFIDGLNKGVVI